MLPIPKTYTNPLKEVNKMISKKVSLEKLRQYVASMGDVRYNDNEELFMTVFLYEFEKLLENKAFFMNRNVSFVEFDEIQLQNIIYGTKSNHENRQKMGHDGYMGKFVKYFKESNFLLQDINKYLYSNISIKLIKDTITDYKHTKEYRYMHTKLSLSITRNDDDNYTNMNNLIPSNTMNAEELLTNTNEHKFILNLVLDTLKTNHPLYYEFFYNLDFLCTSRQLFAENMQMILKKYPKYNDETIKKMVVVSKKYVTNLSLQMHYEYFEKYNNVPKSLIKQYYDLLNMDNQWDARLFKYIYLEKNYILKYDYKKLYQILKDKYTIEFGIDVLKEMIEKLEKNFDFYAKDFLA